MKDTWVKIGYIANTHGIKGELKVESVSDVPDRLLHINQVYVGKEKEAVRIRSARAHKGVTLLQFAGYEDINRVLQWKGQYLYVPEKEIAPLPEDSWYHFQLIGLQAVDPDTGLFLGQVTEVLETYANDVLCITTENGEMLVPFVAAFVGDVDLHTGTIEVRPTETLE